MVKTTYCDKSGLKRGTWTPEEDWKLIAHVTAHGHNNWRQLPKLAGLARCGKSCRLRWMNYLRPGIKRGKYTHEEEDTIIKLRTSLGNRWSVIASHLPGRSDNEIKNHWHAHLKKRFQHHSLTNEKAEASNSNNHSVESIQENNYSLEVAASPFQNTSLASTYPTPDTDASPSSQHTSMSDFFCMVKRIFPAASDVNLDINQSADSMEEYTDPISAYYWKELYEISNFSGEFLAPFVTEPQSFCPVYDLWGMLE